MPIRPTSKPSTLNGQENGKIPASLLRQVDDKTGYVWLMAELPARAMRALRGKVHEQFGVWLSSTGRGRSFDQQLAVFVQRHKPVTKAVYDATPRQSGAVNKRIWLDAARYGYSSIYWLLLPGMASAAVPGTSPHGWWCADDVCLPGNVAITARADILQWLYANELDYGFAHSLESEPWHLQWYMGDSLPPAVVRFEGGGQTLPPPVQPPAQPPIYEDDDMADIVTNAEQFYAAAPLVWKAILMEDGRLRHLDELEWQARGSKPGYPWPNSRIGAAGVI